MLEMTGRGVGRSESLYHGLKMRTTVLCEGGLRRSEVLVSVFVETQRVGVHREGAVTPQQYPNVFSAEAVHHSNRGLWEGWARGHGTNESENPLSVKVIVRHPLCEVR
jgi:hypothetical protein